MRRYQNCYFHPYTLLKGYDSHPPPNAIKIELMIPSFLLLNTRKIELKPTNPPTHHPHPPAPPKLFPFWLKHYQLFMQLLNLFRLCPQFFMYAWGKGHRWEGIGGSPYIAISPFFRKISPFFRHIAKTQISPCRHFGLQISPYRQKGQQYRHIVNIWDTHT